MKLLFRAILMMLGAVVVIYAVYSFVLHGNFANAVVFLFQKLFSIGYAEAEKLYFRIFRQYFEFWVLLAVTGVFCVMLAVYLHWFTTYFAAINAGMDVLMRDGADTVSLPPELLPLERKMNTVKRTAEEQKQKILAAEQKKNDMIMYLAHDLKTPLASVIGYLNLLCDAVQLPEELRGKYLMIALQKAERLEDLIEEFFEIARLHLTEVPLQLTRINFSRMIEQIVYEFHPMLAEKQLSCRLCMEEMLQVQCDADKMQRVLDNLLRNALLYSFSCTEIVVSAAVQKDDLHVRIENHGDTIPTEQLERIFEQFYRLDTARGTGNGGAGLGLAIARQIVERHHGTLSAESENGTTAFLVTLPVSQQSENVRKS